MRIHLLGYSESTISRLLDALLTQHYKDEIVIVQNMDAEESIPFAPPGISYKKIKSGDWEFDPGNHECLLGVTRPQVKKAVFEFFQKNCFVEKKHYRSLWHSAAVFASTATLRPACFIEPGTVIASFARLGFGVYVNRGATIGHHTIIGDFATINPGVHIAGHCSIGAETQIGIGTVIFDHIKIGSHSIIGGGSVVTKDIPGNVLAWGNPCRVIKTLDQTGAA